MGYWWFLLILVSLAAEPFPETSEDRQGLSLNSPVFSPPLPIIIIVIISIILFYSVSVINLFLPQSTKFGFFSASPPHSREEEGRGK